MRLIFFGTPHFSLPSLRALALSEHQILMVVTQPDKVLSRRGKKVSMNPVKKTAQELSIPVLQPNKIEEARKIFEDLSPDAMVVELQPHRPPSLPSWSY